MKVDDDLLDAYARHLGRKLVLAVHLEDSGADYFSEQKLRRDHVILARFGYDVGSCPCPLAPPEVSVDLWDPNHSQIASSEV